jgi:hypothetical protein
MRRALPLRRTTAPAHATIAFVVAAVASCGYPDFVFVQTDPPRDATAPAEPPDVAPLETSPQGECPVERTRCLDLCVVTTADPAHCGGCDRRCRPEEGCFAGRCLAPPPISCAALGVRDPSAPSGRVEIDPDGLGPLAPFEVYCEMDADGGGWTLAMKIDGSKPTFGYTSSLWTDDELFAEGSADLSATEAKLRSFGAVPFESVRVVVVDAGTPRTLVLPIAAASLRDLFAGPSLRTAVGRPSWLGLFASPSLPLHCNHEGVNVDYGGLGGYPRVRLGIVANNENDCGSPDAYLGVGLALAGDNGCYPAGLPTITLGNVAASRCGASQDRATRAFGYVFVR